MQQPTSSRRPPGSVRRSDGRVQLGLGPDAWVVEGWDPASRPPHDPATGLLRGLVERTEAPGTGGCSVLGDGELARRLRAALPSGSDGAGQGSVVDRLTAGTRCLVVLVGDHLVPVGSVRRPDLAGRAVLPVVVQSARVVVGPWTGLPGCPCLHCLDLQRRDRDPAWPALAAGLEDPLRHETPPAHDPVVLDLASALTQLLVAGVLRAQAPSPGLGYEVGGEAPHLVTRRWSVHPACPWHRSGGG